MDITIQLIGRLTHHDPHIRRAAAKALGRIEDERAVEPLIAALHDVDDEVRCQAALALGRIGDGHAVAPLIAVLRERERAVRTTASAALTLLGETCAAAQAYIGDVRAVAPLIKALEDKRADVRAAAAVALGYSGDIYAVNPLIDALLDGGPAGPWLMAAEALGRIALRHPAPHLREAAPFLQTLARFAFYGHQRSIYLAALVRIEQGTAPVKDLPLPSSPPQLSAASLPVPTPPPSCAPDSLPIPAHAVSTNAVPPAFRWRQRLRRAWRR